jgi:hypothetical protein
MLPPANEVGWLIRLDTLKRRQQDVVSVFGENTQLL